MMDKGKMSKRKWVVNGGESYYKRETETKGIYVIELRNKKRKYLREFLSGTYQL